MNPSQAKKRRVSWKPAAESLETRQVLSGGAGNTIAIIPAQITTANQNTDVQFTVDPKNFASASNHKLLLGVAAVSNGSSATPTIEGIYTAQGKKISSSTYAQGTPIKTASGTPITPSNVATLPFSANASNNSARSYILRLKGKDSGTGAVLTGFYLVGDQNGDGKVTKADITAIKKLVGTNSTSANYDFNADANRDGKITQKDVQLAQQNVGASVSILPLISADLNPSNTSRIVTTPQAQIKGVASAGATVSYTSSTATTPAATATADTSGNYTVNLPLVNGANTFKVSSSDSFGQSINGTIAPITYKPLS